VALHLLPPHKSGYRGAYLNIGTVLLGDRGSTVVKVLCYKSEGRYFGPSWCQ